MAPWRNGKRERLKIFYQKWFLGSIPRGATERKMNNYSLSYTFFILVLLVSCAIWGCSTEFSSEVNKQNESGKPQEVFYQDSGIQINSYLISDSEVKQETSKQRSLDVFVYDSQIQDSKIQDSEIQDSKIQDSKIQDSKIQDSEIQDSKIQDSKIQDSGIPDVVQDSNIQDENTIDIKSVCLKTSCVSIGTTCGTVSRIVCWCSKTGWVCND